MQTAGLKKSLPYRILKKIYSGVKRRLLARKNIRVRFACNQKWYGNDYGGFYICPEMLTPPLPRQNLADGIVVYSAGVGEDVSFDMEIMKDFNCTIFAFDPTPKSIEWIRKQNMPGNFIFFPYGISGKTETQTLHLSNTSLDISASIYVHHYTSNDDLVTVQMKSLDDIAREHNHAYVDILKMDIEGSEFQIIEHFPKTVVFGQIVVEFHERFLKDGVRHLQKSVKALKKQGYYCFAVSKHGDEYSFINKKLYKKHVKAGGEAKKPAVNRNEKT
jgi:FkbM family methyltransferase